ncbi:MAG: hypothetical protein ACT4RN_09150 [Pseudonocardia sp.]
MVLDLSHPLSWRSAVDTVEMLDNLQAGILAAHVRDYVRLLALSFADAHSARTFLAGLVEDGLVKSARTHLDELDAFHAAQVPGGPHVGVALTQAGYALLCPTTGPDDPEFLAGMPGGLDAHALVGVADAVERPVRARLTRVRALMPESTTEVVHEVATPHDVPRDDTRRIDTCPLGELLVPEPGASADENRFGSYLVYRKLQHPEGSVLSFAVGARIAEPPLPDGFTVSAGAYLFLPSLGFLRCL